MKTVLTILIMLCIASSAVAWPHPEYVAVIPIPYDAPVWDTTEFQVWVRVIYNVGEKRQFKLNVIAMSWYEPLVLLWPGWEPIDQEVADYKGFQFEIPGNSEGLSYIRVMLPTLMWRSPFRQWEGDTFGLTAVIYPADERLDQPHPYYRISKRDIVYLAD